MATLSKKNTGSFEIQFRDENGDRKTVYLGRRKFTERTAVELKEIIERLVLCRMNTTELDRRSMTWLETASTEIQRKLSDVGLIAVPDRHTLKELWDSFLGQITGIEESTLTQYEDKKRIFFEFFKESESLLEIGKDRMIQWRACLQQRYAKSTVTGTLAKVKAAFNWAKTQGWITESPLDGVSGGGYRNKKTEMFIPVSAYYRMLDYCPDPNWAALLTLFRIGGLRPCEAMILKWENVDFEKQCFLVRSPKTKRHEGKEQRLVPLFPEIKRALDDLKTLPETEDGKYVINLPGYRNREKANPGPRIKSIADAAGLKDLPRPCDNLRASRSNEVRRYFDDSLEVAWIGHSKEIRKEYYDMVIDCDYRQAASFSTPMEDSVLSFADAAKRQGKVGSCTG